MDSGRAIRLLFANGLRVIHIALWMTVPTVLWHWLVNAEPPAECAPKYGWYQGNVLCVSEDEHLFIFVGLFLVGLFGFGCWIGGYSWQLVGLVLRGDETLPPVRLRAIADGFRVFCLSFRYWLPAIVASVTGYTLLSRLAHEISDHGFATLMLASAPVALVMYWGNLVGLARYAAHRERPLVWRRGENVRLALTKCRSTLLLTVQITAVTSLCVGAWLIVSALLIPWQRLDLMSQAALGSFFFYVALFCCGIACSRLVASYAIRIGIGDQLKPDARLDVGRPKLR